MLKILLSFPFLKGINGEETEKENIPIHSPVFSNYKGCGLKPMKWNGVHARAVEAKRLIPDQFWNQGHGNKRWPRLLETMCESGSDTRLAGATARTR